MKRFGKIAAGILFVFVFLLFLIVGTVRFELLNSWFVFSSLERNGVYERLPSELAKALPNDPQLNDEEKEAYAKIVAVIPPEKLQSLFEKNVSSVLNYLNGGSKDITISLSLSDVGIPLGEDITWSLSKTPPQDFRDRMAVVYGIGNMLFMVWVVLIALLLLLYRAVGKRILLITGIFIVLLGGVGRLFLWIVSSNTHISPEPSQVFLALLSISILPDIAISWLFVGILLVMGYGIIRFWIPGGTISKRRL